MHTLCFDWSEQTSLARELAAPVSKASLRSIVDRPVAFTLWHNDNVGLRIRSRAHDVAERTEVGVLVFDLVYAMFDDEKIIKLPDSFNHQNSITKLLIIESGVKAESGIIIKETGGLEIIVVAGVMPYSIAINGIGNGLRMFEPEYQIKDYIAIPMI